MANRDKTKSQNYKTPKPQKRSSPPPPRTQRPQPQPETPQETLPEIFLCTLNLGADPLFTCFCRTSRVFFAVRYRGESSALSGKAPDVSKIAVSETPSKNALFGKWVFCQCVLEMRSTRNPANNMKIKMSEDEYFTPPPQPQISLVRMSVCNQVSNGNSN